MSETCPCGSGSAYALCCQPYHTGAKPAPTPVALMRSRYTAYVLGDVEYLLASWHPACQAQQWRDSLVQSAAETCWLGLHILEEAPGAQPDEGYVEFAARFSDGPEAPVQLLHERSRFLRVNERWYYRDGVHLQSGRNDACPCGSGKKYKKCCGR